MRAALVRRPAPAVLAATAALVAGAVIAARPTVAAALLAAAVFVPVVMTSVTAGVAVWIPAVFVVLGLATTGMQLLIGAAWVGSLVARPALIHRVLPGGRFLIGALFLLLAWLGLSMLWARDAEMTWQELRWWFVAGGVLVVVATSTGSPGQVRLLGAALVAGALLSVVVGVLHPAPAAVAALDTPVGASRRFSGAEGNPNDLAAQLLPAIVFAATFLADRRPRAVRVALVLVLAVLVVAFAATESRGGLVAAIVVAVAAVVLHERSRRLAVPAITLAAVAAVTWFAVSPRAFDRVTSVSDGGAGRTTLWAVAGRMAVDHAPEGVGLNNFRVLARDYVREPGALRYVAQIDSPHVVHNTYLQLLAETGVIGLALFLAVAGACLAAARRAALAFARAGRLDLARLARAVLLAELAVLAVQIFQSNGYDVRFWVVLALGPALWAVAVSLSEARAKA